MTRLVLLVLAAALPSALAKCASAHDCSLGGTCGADGRCVCFPTWKGENCSELHLLPSTRDPSWRAWDRPGNQSSWGGSVVQDPATGLYHMYAADAGSTRGSTTAPSST